MKSDTRGKVLEVATFDGQQTLNTYSVEIANEGTVTLSYDLNGNLVSRVDSSGTTTYAWDAANHLIEITYPDGSSTEFENDWMGRRIRTIEKDGSGVTTSDVYYAWDGFELVQEQESSSSSVRRRFYRHGVEVVSGGSDPTGDYFYTFDHLGSIREVTDDQGALVARYDYDPYGRTETMSGSFDADFRFTGHYYHEKSGLHLAPFRAYDAELGRWLSRDPIERAEFLPEGPNLYAYVGGNPVNLVDPLGLSEFWWNAGERTLNFAAGLGNAVSFGGTTWLAEKLMSDEDAQRLRNVKCENSFKAGEWASIGLGGGRLAYAGTAKAGSLFYRAKGVSMANARAASTFRNNLKKTFRLNPFSTFRVYPFDRMVAKYGDPGAIISATGRTNPAINAMGALSALGGATTLATRDCN